MPDEITRQLRRIARLGFLSVCPYMLVEKGSRATARMGGLSRVMRPQEGTGLRQRLWAYRHGFLPDKVVPFGLTEDTYRDYVPCMPYKKAHPLNGMYSRLIDNKLFLPYVLGPWPGATPRYYFLLRKGDVIPLSRDAATRARTTLKDVLAVCREAGELIVKPQAGTEGRGVIKLRFRDGAWTVDDKPARESDVLDDLSTLDDFIVTECIVQHEYSSRIFPHSVNTLRIVTMRDYEKGEQFVGYALHRFGCEQSRPADNWRRGGLCCLVDMETGRLSRGNQEKGMRWHEVHPDTRARIEGAEIPGWDSVKERIREMANGLAFLPYMGWDVVLTDDGLKVLEINSLPGVYMPQVHAPLLTDSRIRAFFAKHGVAHV